MSLIKSNLGGLGGSGAPGGALGSFYSHTINQSLRCNGSNEYLTRTPSTSGNRRTWTFAAWVKLGVDGVRFPLIEAYSNGTNFSMFNIHTDGRILFYTVTSGTDYGGLTTQKLRDPSAWYHIVFRFDSTQSTAADRIRIYINGTQQETTNPFTTDYGTLPQNYDDFINHTVPNHIIKNTNSSQYGQGYIAEVHHADGASYGPDTFAETKDGVWVPKAVSGVSYGTNGFYLNFADSSDIGNNANSTDGTNDWTVNNFTATDVVPDTPTNNFGTMNPLDKNSINLSEGNLKVVPSADYKAIRGNFGIPTSGKWYFEARILTPGGGNVQDNQVGIVTASNVLSGSSPYPQAFTYGVGYLGLGQINRGGSAAQTSLTTFTAGKILGVAVNVDDDEVQFYLDGSAVGTTHALVSTTEPNFPFYVGATSRGVVFNFGQDSTFAGAVSAGGNADANGIGDFAYAPPSGFSALCTSNLPDPTIGPGQSSQANEHFDTVLYTGNGSSSKRTDISYDSLIPDFVWVKQRSSTQDHALHDTVRGSNKKLESNNTDAEVSGSGFGTDGLGGASNNGTTELRIFTASNEYNASSATYVAWGWKAGTAFSNDASATGVGSLDSTGSVNQAAGFSIISYTGTIQTGETVAHGLGGVPELIIAKNRDSAANWVVFTKDLTADRTLYLNLTTGENNSATTWGSHTATVFGVDDDPQSNGNGDATIAYLFRSIEGFSKVGSFVGNGSTDGPFVYTGFRPAWFLVRRSSAASNWTIFDNKRGPFNEIVNSIDANVSNAEETGTSINDVDFLSNGIKIREDNGDLNASGGTIIYLAFAEAPFKFANAR